MSARVLSYTAARFPDVRHDDRTAAAAVCIMNVVVKLLLLFLFTRPGILLRLMRRDNRPESFGVSPGHVITLYAAKNIIRGPAPSIKRLILNINNNVRRFDGQQKEIRNNNINNNNNILS